MKIRVFQRTMDLVTLLRRKLSRGLRRFIVGRYIYAEQVCTKGSHRIILRGEPVTIASPSDDDFLMRSAHYRLGWFVRNDIYTAEIPNAFVYVERGIICDKRLRLVAEHGFENRHDNLSDALAFRKIKPKIMRGNFSVINHPYGRNFAHWMIDCIPRVISLEIAYPYRPIVFLMPESANEFQRETLRVILPPHFTVEYVEEDSWVRPERLFWASPVSGIENFMLPPSYFHSIRSRIFARFGLPNVHQMRKRIYISRSRARHRRITNEAALLELLSKFGFESVDLETLPFREQVELFHQCEILVAPHGAGTSTSLFSGPISVVVLYATQSPPNYFHSQAKGLGQNHFYVCGNSQFDDDDFTVDLDELRRQLDGIISFRPERELLTAVSPARGELTDV